MDRNEIVDPGANGEAIFSGKSQKSPAAEKRAIMSRTAGTENTLSRPSSCSDYGVHRKPNIFFEWPGTDQAVV
jgi:hypothetical protein